MKRTIALTLIAGLTIAIAGCTEGSKSTDPSSDPNNRSDVTSAAAEESENLDITNESTTELKDIKLNVDLLSDIGKTYAELKSKYGDVSDNDRKNSGKTFGFEKSSARYNFNSDNGVTQENDVCYVIDSINANDLFWGLEKPTLPYEISEKYGVKHISTRSSMMEGGYTTIFETQNHYIFFYTTENGEISFDTPVFMIRGKYEFNLLNFGISEDDYKGSKIEFYGIAERILIPKDMTTDELLNDPVIKAFSKCINEDLCVLDDNGKIIEGKIEIPAKLGTVYDFIMWEVDFL